MESPSFPLSVRNFRLKLEDSIGICQADDRRVRELISSRNTKRFLGLSQGLPNASNVNNKEAEREEVSLQLRVLKQTFNKQYTEYTSKRRQASSLDQSLSHINSVSSRKMSEYQQRLLHLQHLEAQCAEARGKQDEELEKQKSFFNTIQRTTDTITKLRLKVRLMRNDIRIKDWDYNRLLDRRRAKDEHLNQTRAVMKDLVNDIAREKTDLQRNLSKINADVKRRELVASRRAERRVQTSKAHEEAILEHESKGSERLRELTLLYRFWFVLRRPAFNRTEQHWSQLVSALNSIKAQTKCDKISVIVEKFLSKEIVFQELIQAVKRLADKIDVKEKQIRKIETDLNFVVDIDTGNQQLKDLQVKIPNEIRKLAKLQSSLYAIQNSHKKIRDWAELQLGKIGHKMRDNWTLTDLFSFISKFAIEKLKIINLN